MTAAANQDRGKVLALIAEGADVNETRADGATTLLWTAHWDDLELTRRLLSAGADVEAVEDHGVTPLARAVENTSLAMVETLIAAGADVIPGTVQERLRDVPITSPPTRPDRMPVHRDRHPAGSAASREVDGVPRPDRAPLRRRPPSSCRAARYGARRPPSA